MRDTPDPAYTRRFPFYDANHCLGYESWRYTIWPGIAYVGERLWREVRARKYTILDKVLVHPSGAMELRMIKPTLRYTSGQWIFLQVPEVSGYEWHPFSITSAPDDPYVSVTISQVGDWTQALGEIVGAGPGVVSALAAATAPQAPAHAYPPSHSVPSQIDLKSTTQQRDPNAVSPFFEVINPARPLPHIRIDGPYGAPSEDVFDSDVAVLVGAGIGVTPFASVLKHIWYRQRAGNPGRLRRVELIWIVRDVGSFAWLRSLLSDVEEAQVNREFSCSGSLVLALVLILE